MLTNMKNLTQHNLLPEPFLFSVNGGLSALVLGVRFSLPAEASAQAGNARGLANKI